MRTEKEMFDLILGVAEKDERILGVYMNGSRANPKAPKDIFQDFDIVYVVKETKSFIRDKEWVDIFGERLIMQLPDELDKIAGIKINFKNDYGYLMQFIDGNRIDLHIQTKEFALKELKRDKLSIILLDKDNIFPKLPEPTDEEHWIKKPTEKLFYRACNEFWWVSIYVAKGLWRDEIPYAMDNLNFNARPQLIQML
ncbi:MAG: aminoglycoside 6-adenylyltransferase, partial [Clostridium sp.]|nr:aminoglycoside 6-adenylyltransferase [Clostridium sp.]